MRQIGKLFFIWKEYTSHMHYSRIHTKNWGKFDFIIRFDYTKLSIEKVNNLTVISMYQLPARKDDDQN